MSRMCIICGNTKFNNEVHITGKRLSHIGLENSLIIPAKCGHIYDEKVLLPSKEVQGV